MPDKVFVVRPYSQRIRQRVFDCLTNAGLKIQEDAVVPNGTGDDEAVRILPRDGDAVLLVPFHAHRDAEGKTLNGLDFLRRLDSERPDLSRAPVLMPVSATGMAAASLILTKQSDEGGMPDQLRRRILLISEPDLDDPALASRVRNHVDGRTTS